MWIVKKKFPRLVDFVDTEKYIFKNEESHFFSMIFEMDAHTIQKCFHYEN